MWLGINLCEYWYQLLHHWCRALCKICFLWYSVNNCIDAYLKKVEHFLQYSSVQQTAIQLFYEEQQLIHSVEKFVSNLRWRVKKFNDPNDWAGGEKFGCFWRRCWFISLMSSLWPPRPPFLEPLLLLSKLSMTFVTFIKAFDNLCYFYQSFLEPHRTF